MNQFYKQDLKGESSQLLEAYGFRKNFYKTYFTWFINLVSLGTLPLFFYWYPYFYLCMTHSKCVLNEATKVFLVDYNEEKSRTYFIKDIKTISTKNVSDIQLRLFSLDQDSIQRIRNTDLEIMLENGSRVYASNYRAFWCKKQCYIWDEKNREFSKLARFDRFANCSDLGSSFVFDYTVQLIRRMVYGNNEIKGQRSSIAELALKVIMEPSNVLYAISSLLWNQDDFEKAIEIKERVWVKRGFGSFENVSSSELAPGDIIQLPRHQGLIVCDAVLLNGSCIVNEAMLSGESTPVLKTPLPAYPTMYDSKMFLSNTIFGGTTIMKTKNRTNEPVLARVIGTGYQTSKGSIVTSILYPPKMDFKFDKDSDFIRWAIFFISLVAIVYPLSKKDLSHMRLLEILAILTLNIPPALPSILKIGTAYAQSRLECNDIKCTNSNLMNLAGSIDCICLDKTGTLTEEGLELVGVVANESNFGPLKKEIGELNNNQIIEGMLVCHSLFMVDGQLIGNQIDMEIFSRTGWTLLESTAEHWGEIRTVKPPKSVNLYGTAIEIIHQYPFSNELQRMSVIARVRNSSKFVAYTKGSPEMIMKLSKSETHPNNIKVILKNYTEQGLRVIGFGFRELNMDDNEIQSLTRDEIENHLKFLGFVVFRNKLKKPTLKVIRELRCANLRSIMVTGDNMETAISVAKECELVREEEVLFKISMESDYDKVEDFPQQAALYAESLTHGEWQCRINSSSSLECLISENSKIAVSGQTWDFVHKYRRDLLLPIYRYGVVFARMRSDQKKQLIVELAKIGHHVGKRVGVTIAMSDGFIKDTPCDVAMCGDGANDCAALRAAHIGISLSDAEISVASPFVSKQPDIGCIPMIVSEGRAALTTSFGLFKYIFAMNFVQFSSALILYSSQDNIFNDFEWTFIDVFLVFAAEILFGDTEAAPQLSNQLPDYNLLSFKSVASFCCQVVALTSFQLYAFCMVRRQDWLDLASADQYESYSVFCLSLFQYLILAFVFSRGRPHRKSIYTNYPFTAMLVINTLLSAYITLNPAQWILNLFQLSLPLSYKWRCTIIFLALVNFGISFGTEEIAQTDLIKNLLAMKYNEHIWLRRKIIHDIAIKTKNNIHRFLKEWTNAKRKVWCKWHKIAKNNKYVTVHKQLSKLERGVENSIDGNSDHIIKRHYSNDVEHDKSYTRRIRDYSVLNL
uniref:Cation-transporting ATPase n=1 Tax=Trichogramma kaykai TaxID=54128 RepID=A0ABD2WVW2_9HYME